MVGEGEGFSGTTIKDTWTRPRGWVESGERGGDGWDRGWSVGGKSRQLYLKNNNIKKIKKKKRKSYCQALLYTAGKTAMNKNVTSLLSRSLSSSQRRHTIKKSVDRLPVL